MIEEEVARLKTTFVGGNKFVTEVLSRRNSAPLKTALSIADLMCRQELDYEFLKEIDPNRPDLPADVVEQVCINIKYEGYIERQLQQVKAFHKNENHMIPDDIDYDDVLSLRLEARQKTCNVILKMLNDNNLKKYHEFLESGIVLQVFPLDSFQK